MLSVETGHVKGCKALEAVRNHEVLMPYSSMAEIEFKTFPGDESRKWIVYRCLDVACDGKLYISSNGARDAAYEHLHDREHNGG